MDQPTLAPTETPVLDRGDRDETFVVLHGRLYQTAATEKPNATG